MSVPPWFVPPPPPPRGAHDPRVLRSLPKTGERGKPQAFAHLLMMMLRESGDTIRWREDGAAFIIVDHAAFVAETLVKYFRHSQYTSFQRQLNLYGFRKNKSGAFEHEFFRRDRPELLTRVLRSPQANKLGGAHVSDLRDHVGCGPPPAAAVQDRKSVV